MEELKPRVYANNQFNPEFNKKDFMRGDDLITLSRLLDYANLYRSNQFRGAINTFLNIGFTGTINNITTETFEFISTLTDYAQTQFNNLYLKLTNYTYFTSTQTQVIKNNTGITGKMMTPEILTNDLKANNIKSNTIYCDKLITPQSLQCGVYIHLNNMTLPILYSDFMTELINIGTISIIGDEIITSQMKITVCPNYQFRIKQSNLTLLNINNNTSNTMYGVLVNFNYSTATHYEIIYKGVKLEIQ